MMQIITPKPELARDRQLFDNQALKAMIVPLFIEQLLQMVVGIADTLMVSYAGEATVSGVSLDTMIYTIFIYLFTAVATGGAVVVSQYLGNKDGKRANLAASQIYMIAGFVSLACMLLMMLFGNQLLQLLYPQVEPAVMQASKTYLRIVALSFPANALYNAGAAGVAWPTTIAWYFAAVIMTGLCLNPKGQVVATFGTAQIAANGIGQTLWSFAACMSVTMSPVFITVIGQCMGKGDVEAADWYMHKLMRLTMILCISWNALVLALVPLILPLYSVSEEARHLVWVIVIIHNVFSGFIHPFFGPLSAGLRAAGDVKFAMWTSILATVVCRTLFSFILGLWCGMGVVGIALAMGIDWIIKGGLDLWRWRSGKWKGFQVI